MKKFLSQHESKISGVLSCFDRVLFKGYLPISYPKGMEAYMNRMGLLLKQFKPFVKEQSAILKNYAEQFAEKEGRPYIYLKKPIRKDDLARSIAKEDGIEEGLICVFAILEKCQTFKLEYGEEKPVIVASSPRCLCLYYYFLDRDLGFIHVRLQTWFPFTIQIYVNGHEWLARQLDRKGIRYCRLDNAFHWIEKPEQAQRIAERFSRKKWPGILMKLARNVNPLLHDILHPMRYYWVTDQVEYATDLMFTSPSALQALYPKWLEHALLCFSAEDVLTFLGRKLHGAFKGEVGNVYKKRWPGARVKHRMKENWIKMYDKDGCVLRIETVINRPYEFKVRRMGLRQGKLRLGWYPMAKGVANLPRYVQISGAVNARYLDALAAVPDSDSSSRSISAVATPKRHNERSYRGFNPVAKNDLALFQAVMRGEHMISGFRNKDIRTRLFPKARNKLIERRQSAMTSRLLKRLHVHGLIAKYPRSRRYRVSAKGRVIMSAAIIVFNKGYPQCIQQAA